MEILPGTQDILGQFPRLKGYTHLALCFAHPESLSRESTTTVLETATRRITSTLSWIGGVVVHQGEGDGNSGRIAIARCPSSEAILKVQDRSDVCPSYENIVHSKGPSGLIDVALLSAETSLPDSDTRSGTDPAHVLTLTATWIKNGLILDCAAHHNVLDMGGIDQFFQLLATAIQGQEFNKTVIEVNTRDRRGIFPLLGAVEPKYDISHLRCPSSLGNPVRPPPPPGALSAFHHFRFSTKQLSQLKYLAKTPSVDDALSAFIWKRLSAVRMGLGQKADAMTGFSRTLDCGRTLDAPVEYMGNVVIKTYSTMILDEVNSSSMAAVAAQLRSDVRKIRDRHLLRSLATIIAEEPDKTTFNFVKGFNPNTWINASSWAGVGVYLLEFGLLGKPALIRRPMSKPVQSLLYFLPRMEQGDIDIQLCLMNSEIQGLRCDLEWGHFSEYIG
ncbi:hypothetical protein N7536_000175 [Penicillium majusculum]|nr:hypothetical protein N7536_000175 [Penicillium majusculum]